VDILRPCAPARSITFVQAEYRKCSGRWIWAVLIQWRPSFYRQDEHPASAPQPAGGFERGEEAAHMLAPDTNELRQLAVGDRKGQLDAPIQRGKGQQFWTVLSDLVRGEVIGLAKDRTEDSLRTLLTTSLDARQRAAVEAVCGGNACPKWSAWGTSCSVTSMASPPMPITACASASSNRSTRRSKRSY
jgi:hypothetical protein